MKMMSMEMTPEMKKRMSGEVDPSKADEGPKYPWGSRITIEDDHVDALGLTSAGADDEMEIVATAKVIGSRSEDRAGGKKSRSVELQITEMGIGPAKKKVPTAKVLYGAGEK